MSIFYEIEFAKYILPYQEIWQGTCSYIEAVKWCDFIENIDYYIDKAIDRQKDIDDYDIQKEVEKKEE